MRAGYFLGVVALGRAPLDSHETAGNDSGWWMVMDAYIICDFLVDDF